MISRHWRGLVKAACAEAYVEHLRANVEVAVVPRKAHDMMVEYDRGVRHYEVVE